MKKYILIAFLAINFNAFADCKGKYLKPEIRISINSSTNKEFKKGFKSGFKIANLKNKKVINELQKIILKRKIVKILTVSGLILTAADLYCNIEDCSKFFNGDKDD